MVKIFINNVAVYLLEKNDKQRIDIKYPEEKTTHYVFSDQSSLLSLIEQSEKNTETSVIFIEHKDADKLFSIFKSFYKLISAAGGVVKNNKEEVLMIFRRGKWDLPKGKVEKNESVKEAALREVQEETGLKNIKAENQICLYPWQQPCTYHTYNIGDKKILKDTHWYEMQSADTSLLQPQTEEEITKAEWVSAHKVPELMSESYGSIADVIRYSL